MHAHTGPVELSSSDERTVPDHLPDEVAEDDPGVA